jgi:hypothetical protein
MRPAMDYFDVRNDRLHAVQPVAANGTGPPSSVGAAPIPTRPSG